jgi:hypothetical protein
MKSLLPIIFAAIAFVLARQFRPSPTPAVAPQAPAAAVAPERTTTRGVARRAERIAALDHATPAAFDRLYRSGSLSMTEQLEFLKRCAKNDPVGIWNWLDSQELPRNMANNFRNAVADVSFGSHPELVLSRLNRRDPEDLMIAGSLFRKLTSDDPQEAAAVREHLDALVNLTRGHGLWLPKPEEGGGEALLSLPPGRSRDILVNQFAEWWLEKDIAAARVWMKELPDAQREEIMGKAVSQWLSPDYPASAESKSAAAEWLRNEASPATRAKLGPKLAAAMAENDPAAALAWANSNLAAAPLAAATGAIVLRLFNQAPDLACKTVEALPPGQLLHRAAAEIAKAWCAKNPEAAVDWWLDQVDSREAGRCWGYSPGHQLGLKWLEANPDSLRQRIADPGAAQLPASVAAVAIDAWTGKQPVATLDWLASLPPDQRGELTKTAYQTYAGKDPAAAAAQFLQRPELATPAAAGAIASAWYGTESEAAIQWAAALPQGGARNEALKSLKKNADLETMMGAPFPESLSKLLR